MIMCYMFQLYTETDYNFSVQIILLWKCVLSTMFIQKQTIICWLCYCILYKYCVLSFNIQIYFHNVLVAYAQALFSCIRYIKKEGRTERGRRQKEWSRHYVLVWLYQMILSGQKALVRRAHLASSRSHRTSGNGFPVSRCQINLSSFQSWVLLFISWCQLFTDPRSYQPDTLGPFNK